MSCVFGGEWQSHQQSREELAGHIAAHLNGRIELERRLANVQRRKAVVAQVVNVAAEQTQRIDQIANRALVHARHAFEREVATQHRQCRRERAHGRARVAHEKLNRVVVLELTA